MTGGFRVCLHKDGPTWDITRVRDPFRVHLCSCGGVRIEHPEERSTVTV